jgi:Domain of unknown function (DUF4188)
MTAEKLEGDFVVFIIGATITNLFKIHDWLPITTAMPAMMKELAVRMAPGISCSSNGATTHYYHSPQGAYQLQQAAWLIWGLLYGV